MPGAGHIKEFQFHPAKIISRNALCQVTVVRIQMGLNSYKAAVVLYDASESWMGWSNAVVVLVWVISLVQSDEQVTGQIPSDSQLILIDKD